jgi:cell division septum initiation protein DivIVA
MGERNKQDGIVPDFDIVLWGYDKRQVQQCLDDMTIRLEDALSKLDSVDVLQEQLSEARLELDQMRLAAEENPSWSDRLSKIMMTAEALRERAEQDARAIRAGGAPAEKGTPARNGGRASNGARQPVPSAE